jgi:hypothetical protein
MTLAPDALYPTPTDPECLVVVFNLTEPDGSASLERQRAALAGHTSIETLDERCVVLIVFPGWVSRAAA